MHEVELQIGALRCTIRRQAWSNRILWLAFIALALAFTASQVGLLKAYTLHAHSVMVTDSRWRPTAILGTAPSKDPQIVDAACLGILNPDSNAAVLFYSKGKGAMVLGYDAEGRGVFMAGTDSNGKPVFDKREGN